MKVLLVYYSNTGHTMSVADEVAKRLASLDIETNCLDVVEPFDASAVLDADGFIFMTPVNAFSLPQQMTDFFKKDPALTGKPSVVFVNQGLWTPVLGGNRTARQLAAEVEKRGGVVNDMTIISWNNKRGPKIESFLERVAEVFS